MSYMYTCNSSSPFVKVSKKCHERLRNFPGGNGSMRLTVTLGLILYAAGNWFQSLTVCSVNVCPPFLFFLNMGQRKFNLDK